MRRPVIFVLLAGVAALVAALVVYSALKKREAQIEEAMVKSTNVVVAARDLPIGAKLDSSSVKLVRWSKEDMPPGAFSDPAPLMNQFTKTGFVQNEPIVGDRLFGGDKNAGVLPLLIPNGMRAISVPVDEVSDIAGFVLPHTRVDLLVSVASQQNGNQPFSKIVLQNVEVLAIAQEVGSGNGDKPEVVRVVTLLVTPEQAERVNLASHEGALRMAMRNYEDNKIVPTEGISVGELLRSSASAPMIQPQHVAVAPPIQHFAARPKPVEIEIMRNGKSVESVSFVHSHGGGSAPDSGAAQPSASAQDQADKMATAPSDSGTEAGATGGAGLVASTAREPLADGLVPVASPGSRPVAAAAAPAAANSEATGGFGTPHAKTIDIP
jgi:pilus assembly protein CpaB